MSCLKELSLVLIVGCLAVLAADSGKTSSDTPRVIASDQDVRLLINPFAFLQTKTTTAKPARPPHTVVVRPNYHYPHYPHYPQYPHYPNDDYYPHGPHPTHPTLPPNHPTYPPNHPTYHPTRPTRPPTPPTSYPHHPEYPTHPPIYPHYPPIYPQHPPAYPYYPQGPQPPFGFYPPWMYPQQPVGRPPYIVVIHPPTSKPQLPDLPDLPDLPEIPEVPDLPGKPEKPEPEVRYQILRNSRYPYIQSARGYEDYQTPEEVAEEQQAQNDNEDEMVARNIKLDGVSITADSAEDTDTITVDTKDIKLPFGLHLASHPVSGRKIKDQEALIYLRNFKKGRQLKDGETA